MTLQEKINYYRTRYEIVGEINLDHWHTLKDFKKESWLRDELKKLHRDCYNDNQRILLILSNGDEYDDCESVGHIVKNLKNLLNRIDITNFFVIMLTTESEKDNILDYFKESSTDNTNITVDTFESTIAESRKTGKKFNAYHYNSYEPLKISFEQLTDREQFLLAESKTFCIYPWIHLHAYPNGDAYPCCGAEMDHSIGNVKTNTLQEIWNGVELKQLRISMLNETPAPACRRCYEQEKTGFFSLRRSANKHHGHNIERVLDTQEDGTYDKFQMTYWDIRFSNLCNLSCRSCGHIFSSSWYKDQEKLAGPQWALNNSALNIAGKNKDDMWNQLIPHLDYVEQIYFAGGEPLMMEEHYNILDELERRERFDVRLIYNTNFTKIKLKDREVFDYWRKFKSVAVGASLDGSDHYAEYIRHGTTWDQVVRNREQMLRVCPEVDFYVSPTLSILNAWHLPEFHRDWAQRGYIRAQDLNVNILQGPAHLRIDIATDEFKQKLIAKYQEHLEWLRPLDQLNRATVGFESAINFIQATDNSHLIPQFWTKMSELDSIRNENILKTIPELKALK